jgi:hypothetical protein
VDVICCPDGTLDSPLRLHRTPVGADPDGGGEVGENAPMEDHRLCRLSVADGEVELAGPPAALRALGLSLRHRTELVEVAITGGVVTQEETAGPLLVGLHDETTLRFSGGRQYLDIIWDALDGVAEQADTAEDRAVNRHQHIEHFPGDEYRSPESVPLVIVADWPDMP